MTTYSNPGLVLVVDDNARNLELVKSVLIQDGFEVMAVEDAASALQCMVSRVPDIILLDVVMPLVSGFELCAQIKENASWRDVPVVFLSGDDQHDSIRTGFQLGGVDYIRKPFNKEELQARVRTHVELRRVQQRHALQLIERNRVLTMIADEWHKPLQRIVLNTARIKDLCEHLDADTASALSQEAKSAERMLASIETFLQLRIVDHTESGASSNSPFVSQDLSKLVGRWYATAKRKPVDIQLNTSPKTLPMADVSFMARQIVDAVMSNAISFTPPGGSVNVRIGPEEDRIVLLVKDSGPGFPADYLSGPFQPYLRKDENRGDTGALGIGLAIARRAAERSGAELHLSNHRDGGAVVKVSFPQAASA